MLLLWGLPGTSTQTPSHEIPFRYKEQHNSNMYISLGVARARSKHFMPINSFNPLNCAILIL